MTQRTALNVFSRRGVVSCLAALTLFAASGQSCDSSGLNLPGFGSPTVKVIPSEQDIADDEFAILVATTENLPEAATDAGGIHGPAMLRWTITKGGMGLRPVSESEAVPAKAATVVTDPTLDYGNLIQYVPESGASGEVRVTVEIFRPTDRTVVNEFGESHQEHDDEVVASAEAVIRVNDRRELVLTPKATVLPSGGVVTLKGVFNAPNADPTLSDQKVTSIEYEWHADGPAGSGDFQSQPDSDSAVFTAFSEAATFVISLKTTETLEDGDTVVSGPVYATIQIDPKLSVVRTFGYYFSKDESTDSNYYFVVAYVYVPKIKGAISYSVVGQDMHDDAYYGTGATWSFSKAGDSFGSLEDSGDSYRFGLSSAGGANGGDAIGGAFGWMEARFSGMRVLVTAVVQE